MFLAPESTHSGFLLSDNGKRVPPIGGGENSVRFRQEEGVVMVRVDVWVTRLSSRVSSS